MSVRIADSSSTSMSKPRNDNHRFPWKWWLKDLPNVQKNGRKVFSCFSCGGGSSMGYKLAGYEMIGNCEIDPDMNKVYRTNHHPKHSYLMDVRDFKAIPDDNLPPELFALDILDGSPPCSVFSMAGQRESGWDKEKVFREGQKHQRLDDLFFEFIGIAEKLKPKIVIAENVKGLITGNAKGYVNEIIKAFRAAGYTVQMFLLNAAQMGVPQARERVFFICHREDLDLPKLSLAFNEVPIPFGQVRSQYGVPFTDESSLTVELLKHRRPGDKCIADISKRVRGKDSGYTNAIMADDLVASTISSGASFYRMYDGMKLSNEDYRNVQTFPQDFDFCGQSTKYVCGMSVPPVMMANIAAEVFDQWLSKCG